MSWIVVAVLAGAGGVITTVAGTGRAGFSDDFNHRVWALRYGSE